MFGLIASFISGPYGLLLKIGAIVLVIGTIWFAGVRFEHNRLLPKIEEAQSSAEKWAKVASNRRVQIDAQNQAVVALKAESDRRVKAMQERLKQANSEASQFRDAAERRADILANMNLPENECAATFALIDEARK